MQLCFYKARYGNFWDKTISWFTGSVYSHVELRFSDGMCFSASPVESGVRFLYIKLDERWDVIDLPNVSEEKEKEIRNWCETQVGKGYDWFAIFGYFYGWLIGWFPLCNSRLDDSRYWYCSEICTYPLTKFGVLDYPVYRIPPGEVYKCTCKLIEADSENLYQIKTHDGLDPFCKTFDTFDEALSAANKSKLINYSINKQIKGKDLKDERLVADKWVKVSCNSKGCKIV